MVALSGGADSAAAAWASVESGRDTRAVHVHHGLEHSDMLASAAESVADTLGIGFEVVCVEVPAGPSFENQARRERLAALERSVGDSDWIITGHTVDDQVETLLMRIARGTGLDGLVGIERVRGRYVRPLLDVTRSTTRELATLAGLAWRDDPTNADVGHLRNRVRNRLIPVVRSTFGAVPVASLTRLADQVADDVGVLDELAGRIVCHDTHTGVRMAVGELAAAPRSVAARAIRSAFVALAPPHPPTSSAIEEIFEVIGRRRAGVVVGPVSVHRSGPWLELAVGSTEPPEPVSLAVPGTTRWGRFRFEVTVGDRPHLMPLSPTAIVVPMGDGEAIVRSAAADDRISFGAGRRRVFDALAEAGVPAGDRPLYPVVVMGERVVWIPGVRRAVWAGDPGGRYLCAVATEEPQWQRYEP
jgi:tRNA(Ile)-lysidine synthase